MKGTLEFVLESARAVMASLALSYEVETGTPQNLDELKCMAENIYFEGRAEPLMGKVAIGHVVMNRVASDRHPNTICEVVHEGPHRESWKTRGKDVADEDRKFFPIRNKCDFSWYCSIFEIWHRFLQTTKSGNTMFQVGIAPFLRFGIVFCKPRNQETLCFKWVLLHF